MEIKPAIDLKRVILCLINLGLFYVAFFIVHSLQIDTGRAVDDQIHFHLPTIQHFMDGGSVADYSAAVTPLFHWLIAVAAKLFQLDTFGMQLTNSLFTAILISWISLDIYKQCQRFSATLLLTSPLVFSVYVFPSAYWLLPDNITLLLTYAVLSLSLQVHDMRSGFFSRLFIVSILLALVVASRQNFIWLIIVPLVSGALSIADNKDYVKFRWLLVTIIPALITLASFLYIWKGAVPPSFQGIHHGLSYSAPAFFLTVVGCYSVFYSPMLIERSLPAFIYQNRQKLLIAIGIAILCSLLVSTNYSFNEGRYSGLWNIARVLPEYLERSLFIVCGSVLGSVSLVLWLRLVNVDKQLILGAGLLAFVATLVVNAYVFERYMAGVVYLFFILTLLHSKKLSLLVLSHKAKAGLLGLILINIALLIRSFSVPTLLQ